jgi:AcrR family transcriptional regulator
MATRDRLLDATVAVFSEKGYEGARVGDIARRAGLTTGAIYAQFKNKADLLREAIERSSAEGMDRLMPAEIAAAGPAAMLTEMGRHLVDTGTPDWVEGMLVEALVAARRDPVVAENLRQALKLQGTVLAGLFRQGKDQGVFDDALDTAAAVQFCTALSLGMLLLGSLGIDPPRRTGWEELIGRMVASVGK